MGMIDRFVICGCGFNMGTFLMLCIRSRWKSKEHLISLFLSIIAVGFCIWG